MKGIVFVFLGESRGSSMLNIRNKGVWTDSFELDQVLHSTPDEKKTAHDTVACRTICGDL